MDHQPSRRHLIQGAVGSLAATALLGTGVLGADEKPASPDGPSVTKGRINQSVCKWCFDKMSLDELCQHGKKMGLKAIDLLGPEQFATVKKYDMICSMTNSHPIHPGLNKKKNHERCLAAMRKSIEANAENSYPNVICFSGNREGQDEEEGIKVCAEALKQVVGLAEQKKVTLCMELLNSKVNHPDYMCDNSKWGMKLVDAVGSERFKLLYDIYHMQIMEGDVIATIKKHHNYFAHYHTAGVPGRHEIDETQELYYPAIMRAIADTGYKGWVAQEFIPAREAVASLAQAVRICDV
jgi:hydroxypyruvate isomerase